MFHNSVFKLSIAAVFSRKIELTPSNRIVQDAVFANIMKK